MTISIDDLLNTHGMGTSGNQNTGRLIQKTARLTITQPTANVVIPSALAYDASRDILLIYINQRALAKDVDYSILSDEKTVQRKGSLFDAGSVLDFLVVTNIKTDIPTFDGSLLAEGSVVEAKLAKEVRDKLAATLGMDKVRDDIEQLESKTRMMREVSANTQLLTEAGDLIASGTTFGGNGTYEFGNKPDLTGTKTKVDLPVGTTLLAGKVDTVEFPTYTYVTIYDDVNNEDLLVTNGLAGELSVTPTKYAYKVGAVIKRSTMIPVAAGKGYTFPTWNGTPVNRGTLRIAQGWTDEVVLWTTQNDDIETRVKMSYLGEEDKDVLGTKRAGTELVNTSKISEVASVDLAKSNNLSTGHVITKFSDAVNSTFDDFAFDSKKNVYSVFKGNIGQNLIKKFDFYGTLLWTDKELGKPFLIEVAPDDTVYVVYDLPVGQKMVRRFSATGVELWSMNRTSAHSKPVKLLVCSNGDIVIAFSNTTGPSVRRYSAAGALLWEYSIEGVKDIGVDAAGFVNVLKIGGDLYRIRPDGQLHWLVSTTKYNNEATMTVDLQGNTFVGYYSLDMMGEYFDKSYRNDPAAPERMLKKFSSNGTLLWDVHPSAGYFEIANGNKTVYENPFPESIIHLVADIEGNVIAGLHIHSTGGPFNINYIKFDPNGKIILLNREVDRLAPCKKLRISPDGYIFSLLDSGDVNMGFFDSTVMYQSGRITVSGRDVNRLIAHPEDSTLGPTQHFAVDSKDNVYVIRRKYYEMYEPAPLDTPSYLLKYDKDGREIWRKKYSYTLHQVCVDEFDHLYVATSGSDSVIKLDTDGSRLWGKSYYRDAFAIAAHPGGGCFVGYRYGFYQKIDKTGNAFAMNDSAKYHSFMHYSGEMRHFQPRKVLVDSKGRCFAIRWPNRLDIFSATLQVDFSVIDTVGSVKNSENDNPYFGTPYKEPIKLDSMDDIALDKDDNIYYVMPGIVIKNTSAFKKVWERHIGTSGESYQGFPSHSATPVAVRKDGTVFASSSRGLRTLDQEGRLTGLYPVDTTQIVFDSQGNFYAPNHYYSKLGKFPKTRTWTLIEDNKSWFIRTTKTTSSKLTIRIQSGDKITSETVTLDPEVNFRYALLPENFLEGLNIVRFSFDNDGYEEWQVTRTSESLAVVQFLATTEEVRFTDMTLEVRREAGSRSIIHKYLGGIG